MDQHGWMKCVLDDLTAYADQNELPDNLALALHSAAKVAKNELPKVYTDLVPNMPRCGCENVDQ